MAPAVPLPLTPGSRWIQELPLGRPRSHTFHLEAGHYLHLAVEQLGVDVVATVRDPAGRLLLQVDSPRGAQGPEDLFLVAEMAGRHVLEIASFPGAGAGGRYEIRVLALRAATAEDRKRAAAALALSRARLHEEEPSGAEAAAASYRKAATLWSELKEPGREAWALERLGLLYGRDPAQQREAVSVLGRAIDLYGRAGDEHRQAKSLSQQGKAWVRLGEVDRAGRVHERALALWRKLGNLSEQATSLNDLANVRMYQGRLQAAIDLYSQAVEAWSRQRAWRELATTLTNLGFLYYSLGDSALALDQYRRALALLDRHPKPDQRAITLNKLGDVLLQMEGPKPALARYREALELRRQQRDLRGQAVTLNSIGLAWLAANQPQKALEAFRGAEEIFQRQGEKPAQAIALHNLGVAWEGLGRPGRAREHYEQGLALAGGDPRAEETALFGLARVARAEGRLDEAEHFLEKTLASVEAIRGQVWQPDLRSSFLAARQEQHAFLIDLLAQRHLREPSRGYDAKAFKVSERARARSLLDLLSTAKRRPEPEELRRLDDLSQRINARHLDLLAASGQGISYDPSDADLALLLASRRQEEASVEGPRLPQRAVPPILTLAETQAQLRDGEALLLEYFLAEERSFLWAVTPTTTKLVTTLPGRRVIEAAARQTAERMTESHHQTDEVAARHAAARLSQMLLAPVADLLGRRRLVIVAPGVLQTVPFAALPDPAAGTDFRGEPVPLLVGHEIVSLPSASVLAALRTKIAGRQPPPGLLAVVADPVVGADDERLRALRRGTVAAPAGLRMPPLRRLRWAGREAEEILALAGSRPAFAASGFAANRELVQSGRLSGYRILHFATHGIPNDLHPELSALALSAFDTSGRPVDGHLRAYEISDLDLRADLVVLSACRTALGEEIGGEGLVGLTQAFLHAGAPRLVVSLWDVNDRSTGELMQRFYTALLQEGAAPAQALRQAQLSLRSDEQWRAPYHWAGFVLQGEWQ